MLFPTPEFAFVYLPLALLGFHILGRFGRKATLAWLAFISIVFYAYWRISFVPLLLGSITFNYICATLIAKTKHRPKLAKTILTFGIITNLAILFFYKYLFTLLSFLNSTGVIENHWEGVLLPLGISFFTFTQIGYLIDLSEDQGEHQDPITYCVFVTFFPHLIAGPILHHKEVMPQLAEERRYGLRKADVNAGLSLFVLGLAKKLLLADPMAPFADAAFAHASGLTFLSAWGGVLAYTMQLYFDFSGYSDMAIGLARMFSIQFPLNFNSPYKARNIIDFWQRWHMTLTRYITLYIYNPITTWVMRSRIAAGKKTSRKALATPGGFATMIAMPMMITMTAAGIWHGAGMQYTVFGILHGLYLTISHAWRTFGIKLRQTAPAWQRRGTAAMSVLLTFVCVIIAQVFFRADSVTQASTVLRAMAGLHGFGAPAFLSSAFSHLAPAAVNISGLWQNIEFGRSIMVAILLLIVWIAPNTQELLERYPSRRIPLEFQTAAYSVAFYLLLFRSAKPQSFIYFQF
jgi:D-alanyl-lipoteichoic acid acyltransferase DltB (MBOAT superfamily)